MRDKPNTAARTLFCFAFSLALAGGLAAGAAVAGPSGTDPANTAYEIGGERIMLVDGRAEHAAAPGSAGMVTTQIVGPPAYGDLDGDGDDDAVVWLVHQSGGSGSFYHIAAAIRSGDRFDGTAAVFVGDRIMPGELEISTAVVAARYRDRRTDAPMSDIPTIDMIGRYELAGSRLVPVDERTTPTPAPAASPQGDDVSCARMGSERAILVTPKSASRVQSPIDVRGCAVSAWFHEGEVRLRMVDDAGKVIGVGYARGPSDWMSRTRVPFAGSLSFDRPAAYAKGTIIVFRNNTSDDRTLDEMLGVDVVLE